MRRLRAVRVALVSTVAATVAITASSAVVAAAVARPGPTGGAGAVATSAATPGSTYVRSAPVRVADTRTTVGVNRAGAIRPSASVSFSVAAASGYRSDATAVAVTLTAVNPAGPGRLAATAYSATSTNDVGNVYFNRGANSSDVAIVPLTPGTGRIRLWNGSGQAVNATIDVRGFFVRSAASDSGLWHVLPIPGRVVDTRSGRGDRGALPAHSATVITVGHAADSYLPTSGVGTEQVVLTVLAPATSGTLSTKTGDPVLSFRAGRYASASITTRVDDESAFTVRNDSGAAVHIAIDLQAYTSLGGSLVAGGYQAPVPQQVFAAAVSAGRPVTVSPVRAGGVPRGAAAAIVTFSVTAPSGPGALSAWPAGAARPASVVDASYATGAGPIQEAVVPLSAAGQFSVELFGGSSPVVVNVLGWVPGTNAAPVAAPSRAHYLNVLDGGSDDPAAMTALGRADALAGDRFVLLQPGAQTVTGLSAGGVALAGTGGDDPVRLGYPTLVADLKAYIDGYVGTGTPGSALELAVATSNSGAWDPDGPNYYSPADRAIAWADQVVDPLAGYQGVTVDGGNDIEPDFGDGVPVSTQDQALTWVATFLDHTGARFVFNGSAVGCPATPGVTGQECTNGYTQSGLYALAAWDNTASTQRTVALPQIYYRDDATKWAAISSAGRTGLTFLGSLTQYAYDPATYTPAQGYGDLYRGLTSITAAPALRYAADIGQI